MASRYGIVARPSVRVRRLRWASGNLPRQNRAMSTVRFGGLVVTEHEFDRAAAPLGAGRRADHASSPGRSPYPRDGTGPSSCSCKVAPAWRRRARRSSRGRPAGWSARLQDYRVLMLDQRGTGRSAPIAALEKTEPRQSRPSYLACFRADSIVDDAELIRDELGFERWSVLGQSFGGFCVLRYLSSAPGALAEAFLTGGLPPVGRHPDEVYRATYARTLERCRRYYERYPADRERARGLQTWMAENEAVLSERRSAHRPDVPAAGLDARHERRGRETALHIGATRRAPGPSCTTSKKACRHFPVTRSMPSSTSPATPTEP